MRFDVALKRWARTLELAIAENISMSTQIKRACKRVDFAAVNNAARANLLPILQRWLPDGRRQGSEYLALNPHRADRRLGSFRINLRTGRWSDFATGDRGGDVVSLTAFLFGLSQAEAARRLADMLGVYRG